MSATLGKHFRVSEILYIYFRKTIYFESCVRDFFIFFIFLIVLMIFLFFFLFFYFLRDFFHVIIFVIFDFVCEFFTFLMIVDFFLIFFFEWKEDVFEYSTPRVVRVCSVIFETNKRHDQGRKRCTAKI